MLAEFLAAIEPTTWLAIGGFLALMLPVSLWEHIRKRWHEWRRDRRIARDPYILQEELAEFNWKIDDDLEPFEWRSWFARYAENSALFAGGLIAFDIGYDFEWQGVLFALLGLGLLYQYWHKLNDPEDLSEQDSEPFWDRHEIPPEAMYGFVGAIVMVAFLLAFYWTFF